MRSWYYNGGFSQLKKQKYHSKVSPFHRFHLWWHSALLWASGSPGLWFWRGGPAPARAAVWDFPWAPGAPSASPRATLPSARSTWQCDGAAPALAPASPPAPCLAPACLPFRGATKEWELCCTYSTWALKVILQSWPKKKKQKNKTQNRTPLLQCQNQCLCSAWAHKSFKKQLSNL